MTIRTTLALALGTLTPSIGFGIEALTSEERAFFEAKIRPALAEYCYRCHSSEEKIRGGLVLDNREGLRHGGDSGPAVVPGALDASLLWTAINWVDDDLEMPPKEKLPAEVIASFRDWIVMGAPDPRVAEDVTISTEIDIEAGRDFWSFRAPVKSAPPSVRNGSWPISDVDRFVLAGLESASLAPAVDASAETFLRRLSIDLTGLLPSPEEIASFVAAARSDPGAAYRSKVEELLDSKHFGERWGRHWLDVARYGESSGKEINMTYPEAWRYRDYVIASLNEDKPYDQFIREQIAGDLLPIENDAEWQENLIATGFLALGPKGLNERNPRQFAIDLADEQIDTISQAVLGLTVSCARCHDHKSDPIPTADYYALSGIFQSTVTHFGTVGAATNRRATNLIELPIADATPVRTYSLREVTLLKNRLAEAEDDLAAAVAVNRRERLQMRLNPNRPDPAPRANPQSLLRLRSSATVLRGRLATMEADGRMKTLAMGVQDAPVARDARVLVRGELDRPAQEVPRGFLQVLPHTETAAQPSAATSGRLEFAQWLSSPDNPLTARVMVNRIWQQLFGTGLVASPNDFGVQGQRPSHPELLDHLAVRFMQSGWSVKSLIRELVATRTYTQSSAFDRRAYSRDPDNALLWRMPPRRMDAEALRDSMLVASGQLDRTPPLASRVAMVGDTSFGRRLSQETLDQSTTYRSVYLPMVRDAVPSALDLFDAADPNRVTGVREITNVPTQALYLMNNPFVIEQSGAFARRLAGEAKTPEERVERAYMIAFGRPATREERAGAIQYLRQFAREARREGNRSRREAGVLALTTFSQSLLASAEFRYVN